MRMCFARVIAKERSDCGNLALLMKIAAVAPLLRNDNNVGGAKSKVFL